MYLRQRGSPSSRRVSPGPCWPPLPLGPRAGEKIATKRATHSRKFRTCTCVVCSEG